MKILVVSDEECPALWEYATPAKLRQYDLIISCGDLKSEYLSFLVTMSRCPLVYVHGNHDTGYLHNPPTGCDCVEDKLICFNGIRVLGLGGCRRYHPGDHQYTERQMRRRIRRLRLSLWLHGGVDIVVTHAPAEGLGDGEDPAHWGFSALRDFLEKYQPSYMLHGHVHLRYGQDKERIHKLGRTTVINATERYVLEVPDKPCKTKHLGQIRWLNGKPKLKDGYEPLSPVDRLNLR